MNPLQFKQYDANSDAYLSTSKHFEDGKQVTRNYLRVSVRAKGVFKTFFGSSGAEKCLIYISAIRPVESGRAGQDRLFDARPISWPPNKQFAARHIPRGITMFANVVTMKQGLLGWNFHVPDHYGLESVRSHPGPLLLRVTATAENAAPKSIEIEASIKADFSGFEARLRGPQNIRWARVYRIPR